MSNIFIGWSGNSDLALGLSEYITKENNNHRCIIGGNLQGNRGIFVGGTIIEQMRRCDQAILLLQKHHQTGKISENLMFEWGYLFGKLHAKRIHNYFIDITENDLPTDLKGAWANQINTEGKTTEQIIEEIGKNFFDNQGSQIEENMMSTIINRNDTRAKIIMHNTDPTYLDVEMAQYVLCYIYTANIYGDAQDIVYRDVDNFNESLVSTNKELRLASHMALQTLNMYRRIRPGKNCEIIDRYDFNEFFDGYERILEEAKNFKEGELKIMFHAFAKNFMNYLYLLVIGGDELDSFEKWEYCHEMYNLSIEAIEHCHQLEQCDQARNKEIGVLLRSYMYRNMFVGLSTIEELEESGEVERSEDKEERRAKIIDCLNKSFAERKILYNSYDRSNVPAVFRENIEMEYYLAMAECMIYETDQKIVSDYKRKLQHYLMKTEKVVNSKMVFANRIRSYIKGGQR